MTSLSPIRRGFAPRFVYYKKGCTRLAAARDKVCQLLTHGRWFSPVTPASSTTKTGRHDIDEILLKVTLNTQNQSINPAFEPGIIINNLSGRFNLCYCDSEIDDILLVSSKLYLRNPDWKYKVWNMASTKFVWWCLTTISTIFQLYRRCQFYWWRIWRKPPTCGNHQLRDMSWLFHVEEGYLIPAHVLTVLPFVEFYLIFQIIFYFLF